MNVSVLFGGLSFEHEISIVSAISLRKVLKDRITNFIFLDSNHNFYLIPEDKMKANTFSSGAYKDFKILYCKLGGFYTKGFLGRDVPINNLGVLLNLIHGADGEDGHIAGMLDFYEIAFIGARLEACVLSFNKHLTKIYAKEVGANVLEFESFTQNDQIVPKTPYPFIIKPARLGSSLGVSIVKSQDDLEYALDSAFAFDDEIIIEAFYEGVKEYNLAGYRLQNGEFRFSIVEEPKKNALLDFENKYLDFSRTEHINKANITPELQERLQEEFKKIYNDTFRGALIRCDFFVIDDEVFLNEINPIPGSMANYLFDDFAAEITLLANNLPKKYPIKVSYKYIQQIQHAKGK